MIDISAYGFDEDEEADITEDCLVLSTVIGILEELEGFEDPALLEDLIAYLEMMIHERSPITMH